MRLINEHLKLLAFVFNCPTIVVTGRNKDSESQGRVTGASLTALREVLFIDAEHEVQFSWVIF